MRHKLIRLLPIVIALALPQVDAQVSALRDPAANNLASDARGGTTVEVSPPVATPVQPVASEFVIGSNDVLSINVWKEPELSNPLVQVRSDGKISVALVGEVQASGRTVQELQADLSKRLTEYLASPVVTVAVREVRSRTFNILGEVVRPGAYPIDKPTTVVDAIALAGGFREWAKIKSIYILRRSGETTQRIRFDYKNAIAGNKGDFDLQPRDTIVVP